MSVNSSSGAMLSITVLYIAKAGCTKPGMFRFHLFCNILEINVALISLMHKTFAGHARVFFMPLHLQHFYPY